MKFVAGLAMVLLPIVARAQAAPTSCPDSMIYFEFQVTTPASWIADSVFTVHPTPDVPQIAPNLVQFIVDTAGAPIVPTFKALRIRDSALVSEAQASVSKWRFRPATLRGCPVRQLVQTPVGK